MRHDIEIFYHPENPVPLAQLHMRMVNRDFSSRLSPEERQYIDDFFESTIQRENPKAFSQERGSATLLATSDGGNALTFEYAQYKEYLAVSRTGQFEKKPLNAMAYERMRIAAFSSALWLADDSVFVHRRAHTATHVAGVFDCSCAGVIPVADETLYPEKGLYARLKQEIGLEAYEVEIVGVTGVHSAGEPDFSGLITTKLYASLKKEDIEQRLKPHQYPEIVFVPRGKLSDFVVEHYTQNDMNHDGAMTLLSSLDVGEWYDGVEQLQKAGKSIVHARLVDGRAMLNEPAEDI